MIEIKESENDKGEIVHQLYIDGVRISDLGIEKRDGRFNLIQPESSFESLKKIKFSELLEMNFGKIYLEIESPKLELEVSELDLESKLMTYRRTGVSTKVIEKLKKSKKKSRNLYFILDLDEFRNNEGEFTIFFSIDDVDLSWRKPYSFGEYQYFLCRNLNGTLNNGLYVEGTAFTFRVRSFDDSIGDILEEIQDGIHQAHEQTLEQLATQISEDSITIIRSFPPEFRTACEQYLLYFAEFLNDLGVKAKADLSHESEITFLAITPDGKHVSLRKIHEALSIFLELPKSPFIEVENENNGIREIKYIQEVNNLKAKLAQSEIQIRHERELGEEKERTIKLLSFLTSSLKGEVEKSRLTEKKDEIFTKRNRQNRKNKD